MKKIILGMFILLSVNLFGLDHGLISGFEVGYNVLSGTMLSTEDSRLYSINDNSLYVEIKTGYRIENFRIVGTYTNTLIQTEIDKYRPIQDNFRIDLSYTFKNFTIGAFHWCDHPVVTTDDQRNKYSNSGQRSVYVGYYREF